MAKDRLSGLFQAEVIDTSTFRERGEIRIRTLGFNYEDEEKGWEWARVMMPYGGLENMGMQFLPPIGAIGFIMYERGMSNKPIWVGTVMNYWGKPLEDGTAQPVEAEDETDFVIKTQYTKRDDREISSTNNKVENILKMNENELTLAKFHQSDQYEYLDSSYDVDSGKAANVIRLKDEELKLKVRTQDNSADRSIIINGENIIIEFTEGKSLTISEDSVQINQEGSAITVGNDGVVKIDAADHIELAGNSYKAVRYEPLIQFINSVYMKHTHGTPSGMSAPPTPTKVDIKSDKVQLS